MGHRFKVLSERIEKPGIEKATLDKAISVTNTPRRFLVVTRLTEASFQVT